LIGSQGFGCCAAAETLAGVYTLASGAGGATGAIAWGGAPQHGAQPQEYEAHDIISSGGAADFKKIVAQNRNK
jgi:hypothetical protein